MGEEHGFDAIERNVFEKVMGGMFSARDLKTHDVMIYVNGNSAWSEFRWDFHATLRRDGSLITTHGVETQICRKESGAWRLIRHRPADGWVLRRKSAASIAVSDPHSPE